MQTSVEKYPSSKVIGIIDLGSNSLRMNIVRIFENGTTSFLNQTKHMVQLGQGAFLHSILQNDAMQRTMEVLHSFAQTCKAFNCTEIIAIATAAVRDAQNGQIFLNDILEQTGILFTCVSGKEEARLIYKGVSGEFEKSNTMRFFLDIGGGSTEFIVGDSYSHHELDSVKTGCVRLANMFTLGKTGKISDKQYAKMQEYVVGIARHTFTRMLAYLPTEMVASSGTAQNLALMEAHLENDDKKSKKTEHILTYKGLCKIVKLLCSMPENERQNIPGINPRRVDVLIPGAAILQTVMEQLGFDYLRISNLGLRDGILQDYLEKNYTNTNLEDISIQEKSILKLARSCHFEENHAQHVAKLALQLFDSAKKCGLHKMSKEWRSLLYYAAILHDIGIFIAFSGHDDHGKYLITHHNLLGFTQKEVTVIAGLVATHRMKFHKNTHVFDTLDMAGMENANTLSTILKIAEALDQGHSSNITDATFLTNNTHKHNKSEQSINLRITHKNPCPLEQSKIDQGQKIIHKLTGTNLFFEWISTPS